MKCIVIICACRFNPDTPDQLFLNNKQSKDKSHWRQGQPVVLYVHGFTESTNKGEGESGFAIRDGKALRFTYTLRKVLFILKKNSSAPLPRPERNSCRLESTNRCSMVS